MDPKAPPPQPPGAPAAWSPAPAEWSPAPASPARRARSALAAVAGVLALVGAVLSIAGTLVPVTVWGDDSQPPFAILPVLDNTVSNAFNEFTWFALEPIGIGVIATLLGLSLLITGSPRRAGGGALLAFGATTVFAFSAYVLSSVFTESFGTPFGPVPGPGSFLGLASGLLLILAGAIALIGAARQPR
jgi:uncharacterized membrane protein